MSENQAVSAFDEAMAHKLLPPPAERRRLREEGGLSRRRLGEELGVTGQAISFWEDGTREPRGERLVRYVALLTELASLRELAAVR